ncbi:hypothetical protein BH24ACI2_BH24ACI2_02760 [soil metagenome]|jgi:hypothetical protein
MLATTKRLDSFVYFNDAEVFGKVAQRKFFTKKVSATTKSQRFLNSISVNIKK